MNLNVFYRYEYQFYFHQCLSGFCVVFQIRLQKQKPHVIVGDVEKGIVQMMVQV